MGHTIPFVAAEIFCSEISSVLIEFFYHQNV